MQEIRGPQPVPDSVPEDLVAVYGPQARHKVRYRRSRRYRLRRRVDWLYRGRDPWYVIAAGFLWALISTAFGASFVLAGMRWPVPTLYAFGIVVTAALSSLCTAAWVRRRSTGLRRV